MTDRRPRARCGCGCGRIVVLSLRHIATGTRAYALACCGLTVKRYIEMVAVRRRGDVAAYDRLLDESTRVN